MQNEVEKTISSSWW